MTHVVIIELFLEKPVSDNDKAWILKKIDDSLVEGPSQGALNGRFFIILDGSTESLLKVGNGLFFPALLDIEVEDKKVIITRGFLQQGLIDDVLNLG
jgi:hypothetical protein